MKKLLLIVSFLFTSTLYADNLYIAPKSIEKALISFKEYNIKYHHACVHCRNAANMSMGNWGTQYKLCMKGMGFPTRLNPSCHL